MDHPLSPANPLKSSVLALFRKKPDFLQLEDRRVEDPLDLSGILVGPGNSDFFEGECVEIPGITYATTF